jgi:5-methylcytosine-specific restriction endonuclease McrA
MLNIICPDRNSKDDIDNIIPEKYDGDIKSTLQKLAFKIKNRYADYSQIELNHRIDLITFTEEEKKSLQNLYSSKTFTAKKIIEAISKNQLLTQAGCCVYCGIGDADQMDHFLPQNHFPEYSILHKNLLPICGTCNEIKGENIPGLIKDYFHPMFDKLPNEPFLQCQIFYTDSIPISHFSIVPKYQTTRISHHFKDLKLKKRLEKKAIQYFLQIRAYKSELDEIFAREEIERDKSKLGVCFGTNYWKYILCKEMINTNFIEKI